MLKWVGHVARMDEIFIQNSGCKTRSEEDALEACA